MVMMVQQQVENELNRHRQSPLPYGSEADERSYSIICDYRQVPSIANCEVIHFVYVPGYYDADGS